MNGWIALAILLFLFAPLTARAQDVAAEPNVSVSIVDTPLPQALDKLFAAAGRSYQLETTEAKGRVNLSVGGLPLSTALRLMLTSIQPKLEFFLDEDGSYVITKVGERSRPELSLQAGHSLEPFSLAFTPDGKYVVSGGFDRTARLWSAITGREVRLLGGNRPNVLPEVTVSPDGKTVAAACWDKMIHFWNLRTGEPLPPFKGHTASTISLAYSPDGKTLATGSCDRSVRLWDVGTGQIRSAIVNLPKFPTRIRFAPDGKTFAVAMGDRVDGLISSGTAEESGWVEKGKDFPVFLYDTVTTLRQRELRGHTDSVNSIAWDHTGNRLVSTDVRGATRIWDMATGNSVRTIAGPTQAQDVAFSPDDRLVYLGGKAFNAETGGTVVSIETAEPACFALSPDGRYAATSSGEDITFWDVTHRAKLGVGRARAAVVRSVAFSQDSRQLFVQSDRGGRAFNLTTGKPASSFVLPFTGYVGDFRFDDNRAVLYFVPGGDTSAASVSRFDAVTGDDRFLFTPPGKQGAFSPDGKAILSVGESGTTLTDIATKKPVWSRPDLKFGPFAFNASGTLIAFQSEKRLFVLDARTGESRKQMTRPAGNFSTVLTLTNDGSMIAIAVAVPTADPQKLATVLYLVDTNSGHVEASFKELNFEIDLVRFSPDGTVLVAGGSSGDQDPLGIGEMYSGGANWERRLMFIDVAKRVIRRNLVMPDGVTTAAFSPDGRFLATGGFEKSVRLWDAHTLGASETEKLTLFPIVPDGYLWTTPNLSYMASKDALPCVAFRVKEGLFPFEQFDLLLNRPDIILKSLGYAPDSVIQKQYELWRSRLKRMKVDPEKLMRQYHLPEVALSGDDLQASVAKPEFAFTVTASDTRYLLDRLEVTVNNVPVFGREGLSLRDKKTQKIDVPVALNLSQGRNLVTVSSLNEHGIESLRESFAVYYNAPAPKPTLYVVGIGVSEYADTKWQRLPLAAKDATDFTHYFEMVKPVRYGAIKSLKLTDTDATVAGVKERVAAFLKASAPDDTVLVLLAGHGTLWKGNYYFGTRDISFADPSVGGLGYEEIEDLLFTAPARQKLLLMDTCHSGEIDGDLPELSAAEIARAGKEVPLVADANIVLRSPGGIVRRRGESLELMQEMFADIRRGSGAVMISATGGFETAQERADLKNGVFTFSVLEALQKPALADTNKDGHLQVSELRAYVIKRVLELTEQSQKPTSRAENLELDFEVGWAP